jgi:hypothetical protein
MTPEPMPEPGGRRSGLCDNRSANSRVIAWRVRQADSV